jgi:hypothetical protein
MSRLRCVRLASVLALLAGAGCVDRKFVIESNVPNAQVYIDNKSVGAAPAYAPFEYYGYYTIRLVHPGFETVEKRIHVEAPWYAYPPFDFITEVLWPFNIRDTRRYQFDLYEAPQTRVDDILNAADVLRQRGMMLPPPERPAAPRPPRNPLPAPAPLGPPVELPPPAATPPSGVIPSVTPGYTPQPGASYLK